MYLLAKKSGRGEAIELYGHTSEDDVARSWNSASSSTLVIEINDEQATAISDEPIAAMSKPVAKMLTQRPKQQDPFAAPSLDTK